jgi:hypothetical protein
VVPFSKSGAVCRRLLIIIRQDSMAPKGFFWEGGWGWNHILQGIKRAAPATPGRLAAPGVCGRRGEHGKPEDEKSSSSSFLGLFAPQTGRTGGGLCFSLRDEDEEPVSRATVRHAVPIAEGGQENRKTKQGRLSGKDLVLQLWMWLWDLPSVGQQPQRQILVSD